MLLFILIAVSHAAFLILGRINRRARKISQEKLWIIHFIFNGLLWLLALVGGILGQFSPPDTVYPEALRYFGLTLSLFGAFLVFESGRALGLRRIMGFNIFFPERTLLESKGIYKFLNNPMYDGFFILFAGLALFLGISEDLAYAASGFLLLNIFMATLERGAFKINPF